MYNNYLEEFIPVDENFFYNNRIFKHISHLTQLLIIHFILTELSYLSIPIIVTHFSGVMNSLFERLMH